MEGVAVEVGSRLGDGLGLAVDVLVGSRVGVADGPGQNVGAGATDWPIRGGALSAVSEEGVGVAVATIAVSGAMITI